MNLAPSLLYAAERTPGGRGRRAWEVRFTYAALRERVARLAGGLDAEGLAAGDRLAAVVRPRHGSVQLYWACQWVGATLSGVRREAAAALRREVSVDFALGRSS